MVALVLSNMTNLVSLIQMGPTFDTEGEMDAFWVVNHVSETLIVTMVRGVWGSSFIPTFTGLLTQEKRQRAWKLASAVATLVLLALTFAALLGTIFAQLLMRNALVRALRMISPWNL